MRKKLYLIINLILAVIMLSSATMGAYAVSTNDAKTAVELRNNCTLEIVYSSSEKAFSDCEIKLYHVANITDVKSYELFGNFKKYPVTINGTSSQTEWNEMKTTLNSYISADGIGADYTAKTNSEGKVLFENLTAGMYLVSAVKVKSGETTYSFDSFMVAVPGIDESGNWLYDVSAKPKMQENTPSKKEITYKAVKSWRDGLGKKRPESVSIEIYKDGKLQNTVILNSANNWMYSWKTVDDGSEWFVTEKNVPTDYKVGIQKNGNTFNILNTHNENIISPKTGDTRNPVIYLVLMLASGCAILILGITQRKKQNAN